MRTAEKINGMMQRLLTAAQEDRWVEWHRTILLPLSPRRRASGHLRCCRARRMSLCSASHPADLTTSADCG